MKYFLTILVASFILAACTATQEPVQEKVSFLLSDTAVADGSLHSFWSTSTGESKLFISFNREQVQELCKEATASATQ